MPWDIDLAASFSRRRSSLTDRLKRGGFRSIVLSNSWSALIIFLAGPTITFFLCGIGWIVNRPHPADETYLLEGGAVFGLVFGTFASLGFLAYLGARRAHRGWFRFRLRTLFALLTTACILFSWIAANVNWIRQRREFEAAQRVTANEVYRDVNWIRHCRKRYIENDPAGWPTLATLWIFQERPRRFRGYFFHKEPTPDEVLTMKKLFPESNRYLCLIKARSK